MKEDLLKKLKVRKSSGPYEHPDLDTEPSKEIKVRISQPLIKMVGKEYPVVGFLDDLCDLLDSIPEDYRPSSLIRLAYEEEDNCFLAYVYYIRPETSQEKNLRLLQQDARLEVEKSLSDKEERETYERLKKKFEENP